MAGMDGLMVLKHELPIVVRALRALINSHGGTCHCQACELARPLLARIADYLATPVPRRSTT